MSDKYAGGIKSGSTSVSVTIFGPYGGIVSANATGYYCRQGAVAVQFATNALANAGSAWNSGGFVDTDSFNGSGIYRIDVPNAAFAAGADYVAIWFYDTSANQISPVVVYALESVGAKETNDNVLIALARLTATRAGLLDNLDAAISSRLATAGYTTPDNANIATLAARLSAARALLLDNLSRLDVVLSTRATVADILVTPGQPIRTGANGNVYVPENDLGTGIAGAVWDSYVALHANPDTFGGAVGQLPSLIVWKGMAKAGSANSVTLDGLSGGFLPPGNHLGIGCIVYIIAGAGMGQSRRINEYVLDANGVDVIITPDVNWAQVPNNTSHVSILPFYDSTVASGGLAAAVWDVLLADHDIATTIGRGLNDLLRRVGAFTGAGTNTLLGVLRALARSDVAAPTDIGGTYSPASMSLQAFPGRFGFGAGQRFVTITVTQAGSGEVISGVILVVRNAAGTSLPSGYGRTNVDGQAVFSLDDGNYSLAIASPPVFELHDPVLFTVAAAPLPLAVQLTAQAIQPPLNVNSCNVSCRVISSDGTPKSGVQFVFTPLSQNITEVGTDTIVALDQLQKATGADGIMQQELIRPDATARPAGIAFQWRIQCGSLGIDRTLTAELNHTTFDLGLFVHP